MSGGSYDYAYRHVEDFAGKLSAGPMSPKRRAFREHLLLVARAMKEIEWRDSGDGGYEEDAISRVVSRPDVLDAAREQLAMAIEEAQHVLLALDDAG